MSMVIYYLRILPTIREAARLCGYAVGIHGSMERDFDLIAVPWVREAKTPKELAETILKSVNGYLVPGVYEFRAEDEFHLEGCPGMKRHGRLVWSIHIGGGAYLDLSVMPPTESSFEDKVETIISILVDLDEFDRPKKKLPDCPKCGEDELGVIHANLLLCYCCGWKIEAKA